MMLNIERSPGKPSESRRLLQSRDRTYYHELPLHGERSEGILGWSEIVSEWQVFWAGDGRNVLLGEWRGVLSYLRRRFKLPVVYFGRSLGTQRHSVAFSGRLAIN